MKKPPRQKQSHQKSKRNRTEGKPAAISVGNQKPPRHPQQARQAPQPIQFAKTQSTRGSLFEAIMGSPPQRVNKPQASKRPSSRAHTATHPDDRQMWAMMSLPLVALAVAMAITPTGQNTRRNSEADLSPARTALASRDASRLQSLEPNRSLTTIFARAPTLSMAMASNHPLQTLTDKRPHVSLAQPMSRSLSQTPPYQPTFAAPLIEPSDIVADGAQIAMLQPATPLEMAPNRAIPNLYGPIPNALADAPADTSLAMLPDRTPAGPPSVCFATGNPLVRTHPAALASPPSLGQAAADIGLALAKAAHAQTADFVMYNDRYRAIGYPLGDVQPLYGVCTDVVIRAYRSVGIDLQQQVHEARIGGGDTNIEHRRTETLRRFFATFGQQLPVTTIAEDYRPGDVVTYHRPQNRHSRSHIAMVSDVIAPSGRYMIIHNRGWGPQLEDGLFVDQITGHYRYTGDRSNRPLIATNPTAPQKRVARLAKSAALSEGSAVQGLGR